MALMTWSSKHSVGVEALDNRRQAPMKVLNELPAASLRGKAREVAGPLLRQIVSLAGEHFAAEERPMESTGFPGLAAHRAKHRELTARVAEFVSRHEKGDATMCTQLLYFMRNWLGKHMQNEAGKYAPWMSRHGVH